MPPLNHAVLSASSAYRWLECPPSALATADIPDETTIYAQEVRQLMRWRNIKSDGI